MTYKTLEEWAQVLPEKHRDYVISRATPHMRKQTYFTVGDAIEFAIVGKQSEGTLFWSLIVLWIEHQLNANPELPSLPTFDK